MAVAEDDDGIAVHGGALPKCLHVQHVGIGHPDTTLAVFDHEIGNVVIDGGADGGIEASLLVG